MVDGSHSYQIIVAIYRLQLLLMSTVWNCIYVTSLEPKIKYDLLVRVTHMCLAPAFILRSCLISRINIFKSSALHLKKVDKPSYSDEKSCKHRQIYTNQCSKHLITSMFMNRIGQISEIKISSH